MREEGRSRREERMEESRERGRREGDVDVFQRTPSYLSRAGQNRDDGG